jgi:hypothetical protein
MNAVDLSENFLCIYATVIVLIIMIFIVVQESIRLGNMQLVVHIASQELAKVMLYP